MPDPQVALKVALLGPATITDTFGRTAATGWGTATTGGAWAVAGPAADYSVASGTGRHNHPSIGLIRYGILPGALLDVEQLVDTYPAVAPAGAAVVTGAIARWNAANYYWLRTEFTATGTVVLKLSRVLSGVYTDLGVLDPVPGLTYTVGQALRTRSQVVGDRLRIRVWPAAGVEPAAWHLDVADPAPLSGAGQVGLQTWVVAGNTNPTPVVLHHDNYQVTPYWTDLAGRIHYGDGGGPLTIDIGRQTEVQDVEPTRIAATLRNADGALNPRNPSSPYYGTWEQGRQVRVTETVDGEEIDLATGYLEIPDVQVNSPNVVQPCSITAVDRLGRLAGAPAMEGTLAEHVRTYGGTLALHLPLTDAYPHMSSNTTVTLERRVAGFFSDPVPVEPDELIRATDTDGPSGDDQRYARWSPAVDAEGDAFLGSATLYAPLSIPVGATDVLAVSVWTRPNTQTVVAPALRPNSTFLILGNVTDFGVTIRDYRPDASGVQVSGFSLPAPISGGRELERDTWRLVTVRIAMATGATSLWVGADLVATGTATPPAGTTLTEITLGQNYVGSLGHVQVRVGPDATTMTRADHLAQYAHGWQGLDRQTVAERIATLAAYAGVPASELDLPADAATPLQPARLSGVGTAQAMQDAATAGQDILMTTPQGRLTLVPRGRRYNQPVTLQIPWGWLMRGGIRYRPDKPVTDAVATRTGGGTARRVDERLRARYGVLSRSVQLDSAIDADPANWVLWTLQAFGQPRTRCPLIRINLLRRSLTARKALMRLKVGDRVQLTGMPANSPEDVPHLIVQGIRHIIGPARRRILELNTSPLLGPSPGSPPACPVVGDLVSTTAVVAY